MQSFVIEGGRPLSGTVRAAGNKNGALPILAATVLASGAGRPRRTSRGSATSRRWSRSSPTSAPTPSGRARTRCRVDATGSRRRPSSTPCSAARSARRSCSPGRCSRASAARPCRRPGGDVIGRRRLDTHIHAFMELGVEVELNGAYDLRTDGLRGKRMFLDEASVMATENAVMAAVLAEGETIVGHAACEPHIQDLCHFLVSLGAQIEGIGSNILRITGVDRAPRRRAPDPAGARRGRELRGARGDDRRRRDDRGRRARRPDLDRPGVPQARDRARGGGDVRARPAGPGAARRRRPRRPDPEDRERHLARVPGRPHLDRRRRRDPGARHGARLREDVREPALLRRQARLDGRPHHPLRPAPRRRHRARAASTGSGSRAPTSARGWRW